MITPTWNYNSSTNQNINACMSNFTPTVQNSNGDPLIDIFNFNMNRAIDSFQVVDTKTYIAGQRLPVIANTLTGTTSTYWMLGMVSGVMHPYNMKGGDPILIPNISSVISSINSSTANENSQSTTSAVII